MERSDIALEVLAEVSGRPVAELDVGLDLVADLGIDSPRALRLLVELEDRLDVEIPDDVAARISTVGDIVELIATLDS